MSKSKDGSIVYERQEIVDAIKLRVKRDSAMHKDDVNRVSHKMVESYTDDQYEQMLHICSPVVGLRSVWFRRACITLVAKIRRKREFAKMIRGFLFEVLNTFYMSPESKDILLDMLVIGTISDEIRGEGKWNNKNKHKKKEYWPGTYERVSALARERVYSNSKIDSPEVNYKHLLKHFDNWEGGDIFDEIADDIYLDEESKEYMTYVKEYAKTRAKYISSIHNAKLNENCNLGNICVAVNGSLSKYRNKNKTDTGYNEDEKMEYSKQVSLLLEDIALLIGADTFELESFFTKVNELEYEE